MSVRMKKINIYISLGKNSMSKKERERERERKDGREESKQAGKERRGKDQIQ